MDRLVVVNFVAVGLLAGAAARWGDRPERTCAAALALVTLADPVYHLVFARAPVYGTVDLGHLLIDLFLAVSFVGVALWANRVYPLWLAALQLVSVVSHFAREVTATFPKLAYGLMAYGPFYVILVVLAAGIWRHARRQRRFGTYRAWRPTLNPSPARGRVKRPTG